MSSFTLLSQIALQPIPNDTFAPGMSGIPAFLLGELAKRNTALDTVFYDVEQITEVERSAARKSS